MRNQYNPYEERLKQIQSSVDSRGKIPLPKGVYLRIGGFEYPRHDDSVEMVPVNTPEGRIFMNPDDPEYEDYVTIIGKPRKVGSSYLSRIATSIISLVDSLCSKTVRGLVKRPTQDKEVK